MRECAHARPQFFWQWLRAFCCGMSGPGIYFTCRTLPIKMMKLRTSFVAGKPALSMTDFFSQCFATC